MIQVRLLHVGVVQETGEHLMVLREDEGERVLVIGIGQVEASAIAMALEQVEPARPLTHDLTVNIIHRLQARLERVIIHDLRESTFIGQLDLGTERGVLEVDCRASDAVALAVRVGAPIYASESVMEAAAIQSQSE